MRTFHLYNPTLLVEDLLTYKNVPFKEHHGKCPAFPDSREPIIQDEERWIVGLHPIMGYLDRRIFWPEFFPADPDEYAKASMVFNSFLTSQPNPVTWMEIIKKSPFILGNEPCVVDLLLAKHDHVDPQWRNYRERVQRIHGARA